MIYVVIPNYIHREELVKLSTDAILSFKKTADCKVIAVDDCSPMDTSYLDKIADVVIRSEKNGGFAASMNKGYKYAYEQPDCEYIVGANNDIEVYDGWFEEFLKYDFDAIGGIHYQRKPIPKTGRQQYYSLGGLLNDWMFPFAFYMFRKSLIDDVGYFDENYKHGGIEDIDYLHRAKLAGKKFVMTPNVTYWHLEGQTRYTGDEKAKQSKAILENEAFFEKKWGFHPVKNLMKILQDDRKNL